MTLELHKSHLMDEWTVYEETTLKDDGWKHLLNKTWWKVVQKFKPTKCILTSDLPVVGRGRNAALSFKMTLNGKNGMEAGEKGWETAGEVRESTEETEREGGESIRVGLWKCNIRRINHGDCQVLSHLIIWQTDARRLPLQPAANYRQT